MPGTLPTFMCEYSPERIPPLQMVIFPPLGWLTPPPHFLGELPTLSPSFFLFFHMFSLFLSVQLNLHISLPLFLSLPPPFSPSLIISFSICSSLPLALTASLSPFNSLSFAHYILLSPLYLCHLPPSLFS